MYQGLLRDEHGELDGARRMAAGFMAGVTEAFVVVTPFEVVKIRLQQQKGLVKGELKYKGPVHGAAMILKEEGLRGLWSGASPTVMRNGTNQMCLFWAKPNMDKVGLFFCVLCVVCAAAAARCCPPCLCTQPPPTTTNNQPKQTSGCGASTRATASS